MHDRLRARLAWLAAALLLACSPPAPPARFDTGFRGPGKLVVLFEPADPAAGHALIVHDADGARELAIPGARAARWLSADALLVSQEAPPDEAYGLPRIQLLRVDAKSGAATKLADPARYYDAEPDPRGARVAIGVELDDQGESDLLVLESAKLDPIAGKNQPLDRPRWSPDGEALVVLQTLPDPEGEDSESGLSFGGQDVSFPRLFRTPSDLRGSLEMLRDGEPGKPLEAGGTLPLFWNTGGIFARQRRGLVRCDPAGTGCTLVWSPGGKRRVIDARATGEDGALALVRDHALASDLDLPRELYLVTLDGRASQLMYTAPADVYLADLDWIAD
jgi:hypothetical protein